MDRHAVSRWVVVAVLATAAVPLRARVLDDFAQPGSVAWQLSGAAGETSVAPAPELVPASGADPAALRVPIRIDAAAAGRVVWLTRRLEGVPGLSDWERLTFRFRLSGTRGLAESAGLVCRWRTSPTAFVDFPFAVPSAVRPGAWQDASVRLDRLEHVRNVYLSYTAPLQELTFRFEAAPGQSFEAVFEVAALRLEARSRDEPYAPRPTPRVAGGLRRALLVTQGAASYAFVRESLEAIGVVPDRCLFRGLHLPLAGFPASREALLAYDLVALVDVDPYVLTRPQLEWLCDAVASGVGLLVVGGPNSLSGACVTPSAYAALLPVRFETGRLPAPAYADTVPLTPHPITAGLPAALPPAGRAYDLEPTDSAVVLLAAASAVPRGWGLYSGGAPGDGALSASAEAYRGRGCAQLEARNFYHDPASGAPTFLALKLIQGDSDGYNGARGYAAKPGGEYRCGFWLRGDVPEVTVAVTAWTTDRAIAADRITVGTSLGALRPEASWRYHSGTFRLPETARRFVLGFQVQGRHGSFPLGSRLSVDEVEIALLPDGANLAVNPGAEDGRPAPVLVVGMVGRGRVGVLNTFADTGGDIDGLLCCSGDYRTLVARLCQSLAGEAPAAAGLAGYAPTAAPPPLGPPPAHDFPIISWLGPDGGGQRLDERGLREAIDGLRDHGFNTVAVNGLRHLAQRPWSNQARLLDYAIAYARSRGMAVALEYEHLTDLGPDRPPATCVWSPEYAGRLAEGLAARLAAARAYDHVWSTKILDEPTATDASIDHCDLCQAEFARRFGGALRRRAAIPSDDLEGHRQLSQFIADSVARGYQAIRQAADEDGLTTRLLLTYMGPGYGYADPRRGLEDVFAWSRPADVIDLDVYPYFYPVSEAVRMLQVHYCLAVHRAVAEHLGKPFGFYVELDDRNYPFQVNPVEASAECAWTAVGQGCRYLNTFIHSPFGTGHGARPERWEHLGRTLREIAAAGPELARLRKAPAALALYFPVSQWFGSGRHAPHYAYQLLLRACGDCD
ncbi:MAG: hypothetical protein GX595_13965, partial [Lentisphaerae bacterium]|nr:hypothetical protein [Lentisphaerota bacterium]